MPRKEQVVFGRSTSASESFTARKWWADVWASAKLTWGLAHWVLFLRLSGRHFYYRSPRGVVKYATICLLRWPLPWLQWSCHALCLCLSPAPPLSPLHPHPSFSYDWLFFLKATLSPILSSGKFRVIVPYITMTQPIYLTNCTLHPSATGPYI